MNDGHYDIYHERKEIDEVIQENIQLDRDNVLWALALHNFHKKQEWICNENEWKGSNPMILTDVEKDGSFDFTQYFSSSWSSLSHNRGFIHVPSGCEFLFTDQEKESELKKTLSESILVHNTLCHDSSNNEQQSLLLSIFDEISKINQAETILYQSIERTINEQNQGNNKTFNHVEQGGSIANSSNEMFFASSENVKADSKNQDQNQMIEEGNINVKDDLDKGNDDLLSNNQDDISYTENIHFSSSESSNGVPIQNCVHNTNKIINLKLEQDKISHEKSKSSLEEASESNIPLNDADLVQGVLQKKLKARPDLTDITTERRSKRQRFDIQHPENDRIQNKNDNYNQIPSAMEFNTSSSFEKRKQVNKKAPKEKIKQGKTCTKSNHRIVSHSNDTNTENQNPKDAIIEENTTTTNGNKLQQRVNSTINGTKHFTQNKSAHHNLCATTTNSNGVGNSTQKNYGNTNLDMATKLILPSTLSKKKRVTSTSLISSLNDCQGTTLKRLWPDSNLFMKKILRFTPPEVISYPNEEIKFKGPLRSSSSTGIAPLPSTFRNSAEMVQNFTPFLLEEAKSCINQEFREHANSEGIWNRDVYHLRSVSCIPIDPKSVNTEFGLKTYEFSFSVLNPRNIEPPSSLGELFVIYSDRWKTKGCCLGVRGCNDYNAMFLKDQQYDEDTSLFKLWICVAANHHENTGWLAQSDLPYRNPDGSVEPHLFHILNLGTVAPIVREFEGIKGLAGVRKNLRNAIFCDKIQKSNDGTENRMHNEKDMNEPGKNIKPSSMPVEIWNKLSQSMNPFQLNGIRKCIMGKSKENFLLLQGPPGTGKSSAIVGLVTSLLHSICPPPNGKVRGTRINIGSTGNKMNSNNTVKSRILVCAPSNTAIDDLAWRIHTSSIGINGTEGGFNIVRFGTCAGESRHDGRKKSQKRNCKQNSFLRRINLDLCIEENAAEGIFDQNYDDKSTFSNNRRNRNISYSRERRIILESCHVVCTTLNSAGSKAFIEAVSRPVSSSNNNVVSEFDAVIIDEACQASESATLIPLKFNPKCVILVGDPKQLPVMVLSEECSRSNYGRSLFQRLQENGWPVDMLRMQYRMHEEIAKFPSRQFYEDKLVTSSLVLDRPSSLWYSHKCFVPYLIWNHQFPMNREKHGSIYNMGESNFILDLLMEFFDRYPNEKLEIGIISFYSYQVFKLQQLINSRIGCMKDRIQISTVDGFQGSEKDIIILSCVRSWERNYSNNKKTGIGFLVDKRRLNVALTRARKALWVVGNCQVLQNAPVWDELIDDAAKRCLITDKHIFQHLCSACPSHYSKPSNHSHKRQNKKDWKKRKQYRS